MSLRAFHLVFVAASLLLASVMVGWGYATWKSDGDVQALLLGGFALAGALALGIYGLWVRRKLARLGVVLLAFAVLAPAVHACPVCFGDPESPLTKGAAAGVAVLGGVVGFVLVAIASVAYSWSRRARELERLGAP